MYYLKNLSCYVIKFLCLFVMKLEENILGCFMFDGEVI